ncbi:hypothetical protein QBC40DRAFT_261402 [Triangularia verruculosa]|uniref:NADP-dependent oxidoreductase domain-containing protein n=1 Tax=Triangularia verruculosa TaxID=2587418 RepID=A0AAN6XQQ7_9PEZI|nr:hypothetical protein QBC40DRAFT_261402 [Triangularia verruculosa]
MPYSDNLYSAMDDDSDFEPIDDIPSQQGRELSQTAYRAPQSGHDDRCGHARASTHDHDNEDEVDADAFSPVDGYFGSSNDTSSDTSAVATLSNVPHVPNIWVQDPSLDQSSTAASKAREAELERQGNRQPFTSSSPDYSADISVDGLTTSRYISSTYTGSSRVQQYNGSNSTPAAHISSSSPPSSLAGPSASSLRSYTPYPYRATYHSGSSRLVPQDAPPAYTPSPRSPQISQVGPDGSRNYSTFSPPADSMGRREESQGLLGREPESMRDAGSDSSDGATSPWSERITRRVSSFDRSFCKLAFIVIGLVLLSTGFLASLINSVKDETSHLHPPKMTYPDLDNKVPWQPGSSCGTDRLRRDPQSFDVSFSDDKPLTIIQNISHDNDHHSYKPIQIHGSVILRRTDSDHPDPSLVVETTVNNDLIATTISWDEHSQKLVVTIPNFLRTDSPNRPPWPCIHLTATLWTPASSSLSSLSISTTVLSILLVDNLSLSVKEDTVLSSTVGSIVSDTTGSGLGSSTSHTNSLSSTFEFISPLISASTTSAPISGSWPLYNYLSFESTAGNIKVSILPQPDLNLDHPKPAVLNVKSSSGTVELVEPISDARNVYETAKILAQEGAGYLAAKPESVIPVRDYRVDVHTTSGNIKAKLATTEWGGWKSTSGKIDVEVLLVLDSGVYNDKGRQAGLETRSTSGNTVFGVWEPLWADQSNKGYILPVVLPGQVQAEDGGKALRVVRAEHGSTSGDIRVVYPKSWEGEITLGTLSGRLKVGGEGVKVVKGGEGGWPGVRKNVVARKGDDGKGSQVEGKSTSGDIQSKFTPLWAHDKTKIPFNPDQSIEDQVKESIQQTLDHLDIDYLDVFFLHAPFEDEKDNLVAWRVFETFVPHKLRQLGLSNFPASQLSNLYDNIHISQANLCTKYIHQAKRLRPHKVLESEFVVSFSQKLNVGKQLGLYNLVLGLGDTLVLNGTTKVEQMELDVQKITEVFGDRGLLETLQPDFAEWRSLLVKLGASEPSERVEWSREASSV